MLPVIAEHIEIAPGSAGGEARIAGRGIMVRSGGNLAQENGAFSPADCLAIPDAVYV